VRSGWATLEITTVLVAAHRAADGALPSAPWIAAMAAVVFVAGLGVLTRRVPLTVAVPPLLGVQLLLHTYLAMLAPASGRGAMGTVTHGDPAATSHAVHLLGWPMVVAHVAGAVATAAVWELRARADDVVTSWTDTALPPLPDARRASVAAPRTGRRSRRELVLLAPRRGPPGLPVPA
jgi:hypothetical protein